MDKATSLRNALVDQLKDEHVVTDARVEAALRAVPRHVFVPHADLETAYSNEALPTKMVDGVTVSSISQPAMVAIMLEQLALQAGERILEIGAGTGYNAALLAEMVGERGFITTVDIDTDIVEDAQENLARAHVSNVQAVCADGGFGFAPNAPYDATIATVALWDIAPEWFAQLRDGGRLVAPIQLNGIQESIAFQRVGERLISSSLRRCGFIQMRGATSNPQRVAQWDGLRIYLDDAQVDEAALAQLWATTPITESVALEGKDLNRFLDYLGLRGSGFVTVTADKEKHGFVFGNGVRVGTASLAMVTYPDFSEPRSNQVMVYGDDSAFEYFKTMLDEWNTLGRPNLDDAKITAAPLGTVSPKPNSILLRKRWMEYEVEIQK